MEQPPAFQRTRSGYVYEPRDGLGHAIGVRLEATHLRKHSTGLSAELDIMSMLPGHIGHLSSGLLNLQAPTSRTSLAKTLHGRTNGAVAWDSILEGFAKAVVVAWREWEAPRTFGAEPPKQLLATYLIEPLILETGATVVYGDGAIGKGWLAIGAMIAVAGTRDLCGWPTKHGPVLYLDWEDDGDTWERRGWRVARGLGDTLPPPTAHYHQARRGGSLRNQRDQLLRAVDRIKPVLTIVDSVGLASGAGGEHQGYEDRAIELYEGIEDVPGSILLIDHISAETTAKQKRGGLAGRAYGSGYKRFLARAQWEAVQKRVSADVFRLVLYDTKANHSAGHDPLGVEIEFGPDARVGLASVPVSTVQPVQMAPTDRLLNALAEGPLSVADIADQERVSQALVRKWIERAKDTVERVPGGLLQVRETWTEPLETIPF